MPFDLPLTLLETIPDLINSIWVSLNDILIELVETWGVTGLIFAMVFQAIVAPIISEAVLTAAGYGFFNAFGNDGLVLAFIGGFIGSLIGSIAAFYIARGVQGILRKKVVDIYATGKSGTLEYNDMSEKTYLTKLANFLARFIDEDSEYFLDIIERYGFLFVLIGRLTPFIPFDAVSYGAGFTRISFWKYFTPTVIGTIPRIIFYILLGANLVEWAERDLNMFFLILLAFALVIFGLYLLTMKILKNRVKRFELLAQNSNVE